MFLKLNLHLPDWRAKQDSLLTALADRRPWFIM